MMIYTYSSSKKKKPKVSKQMQQQINEYNEWRRQNNLPEVSNLKASRYTRPFSEYKPKDTFVRSNSHVKSLMSDAPAVCAKNSIMDKTVLNKESKEVRDQIIAKRKRIALMYNKGAYQYISDEIDITTIGTRNRRM